MDINIVYTIPGILILVAGNLIVSFSPGRYKAPIGYRTVLSMKNMDVWRAANKTFGIILSVAGVTSIITGLIFFYKTEGLAGVIVVMILSFLFVFIAFTITDRIIKSYYDDNGYRIK